MIGISEIVIPEARQQLTSAAVGDHASHVSRAACVALAAAATAISALMAAKTAATVGGDPADGAVLAAFGVMVILAAHWLPALSKNAPFGARCAAWALWLVCMAYATYSHATYFLRVQHDDGLRRAELVQPTREIANSRNLSGVLADVAKLRKEEARLGTVRCPDCAWLRAQRAALEARAAALLAEAEESKRDQAAREELDQRRRERRADPVTSALGIWVGPSAWLDLVPALLVATVLDGLGCLCWLLALRQKETTDVAVGVTSVTTLGSESAGTAPVTSAGGWAKSSGMAHLEPATRDSGQVTRDSQAEFEALLAQARKALAAGQIGLTVRAIRQHLGCSQASASQVRRALSSTRS